MRFSRNRFLGLSAAVLTAGSAILITHHASAGETAAPFTRTVTGSASDLVARRSCPDGMRVTDVTATVEPAGAAVTAAFPGSTGPVAESGYDVGIARATFSGDPAGEWSLTITVRCEPESTGVEVVAGYPGDGGVIEARCADGDSLVGTGFRQPGRLVAADGAVRLEPAPGADPAAAVAYAFCR